MYDVAIIGAGAAGIAAAKLAANYGFKTLLLEKDSAGVGGTCLNTGCIPTKFFLNAAKSHKSWQETVAGKDQIIKKIKEPLLKHLEAKGVTVKYGTASFLDNNTLQVDGAVEKAKNIIIASGSSPKKILSRKKCIFAEDVFSLPQLPPKILIIGAGYVGIEIACILNSFNKQAVVIEKQDRILSSFDAYLAGRLSAVLNKCGIEIHTGRSASDSSWDEFDMAISSVGRSAQVSSLNLSKVNVATDKAGWINTDSSLRTNTANIYACGDITGKKLLAYTAEYQAAICVNNIAGKKSEENYAGIAECVFSIPQMSSVGILEDEAKKKNIKHKVIKSNFLKYSCAYVYDDINGFIEIVIDEHDKVIGAAIISNYACELISLFSYCIRNNMDLASLKKCVFIHPTLSEIIPLLLKEA